MFVVWAEFRHQPNGIDDAGSTAFYDCTGFAEYAKDRGFTRVKDEYGLNGRPAYYNPDTNTTLIEVAECDDSATATFAADCIKSLQPMF